MAWLPLAAAPVFAAILAVGMKASDGFTRPLATVITVLGGITCLTLAMRTIPVGLANPIRTAVGAFGTVVPGVVLFAQGLPGLRAPGLIAIVAGVARLRTTA